MVARRLTIEHLDPRRTLAAQNLLFVDVEPTQLTITTMLDSGILGDDAPRHREVAFLANNQMASIGLSPHGIDLARGSLPFKTPAGADAAVLQLALDSQSAVGVANVAGNAELTLWLAPDSSISLGTGVVLDAYKFASGQMIVAFDTGNSVVVASYDAAGNQLGNVTLDNEIYADAQASDYGILLWGQDAAGAKAVLISPSLQSTTIVLQQPANVVFANPVGLGELAGESLIFGTIIDDTGETQIVGWSLTGELTHYETGLGNWAIQVSGSSLLVDTESGRSVEVLNSALAAALGIATSTPVQALDIPALQHYGWTDANITDLIEREGELYLGISSLDADLNSVFAVLATTGSAFPSHWQNRSFPNDVNQSSFVSPSDALTIINWLNSNRNRVLGSNELSETSRVDVNGDGMISPVDALRVINQLNDRSSAQGEGERFVATGMDFWNYQVDLELLSKARR